ncbi:MAG TPA: thioredoxin family protein [Anaerolineales bacterium]|nr:thioredoxin family protein [Anaerolineales bacterium]
MFRLGYFFSLLLVLTLACGTISSPVVTNTATPAPEVATSPSQNGEAPTQGVTGLSSLQNSALVDVYDPARNPAEDLKQAIVIAQNENKRIMLELGGDWCIWCKHMDDFYVAHSALLQFRAEHYVLVKVNVSEENMNEAFLSQFPQAAGYPHIYILDRDGTFLHSQDTAKLEDGVDSYVLEVFMAFLQEWAPPSK